MNIVVFAWDFPYPPRGGGRADVWRRIEGFVRLGHRVMLVNLVDPDSVRAPGPAELAAADAVLTDRYSFAIARSARLTVRRLARIHRVPWRVATRIPNDTQRRDLLEAVRRFAPDVLWLDGPWFGEIARDVRAATGTPILYRSHNGEHVYLRRQAAAAARLRNRIAWRIAAVGLQRYQLALMSESHTVFDISDTDLAYWRGLGVRNARWLPPLPEVALTPPSVERTPVDIVFVGGLRTPNNVQGVRWFVREVLPLVLQERPSSTVGIVGSYPDPDLAAELARQPAVRTFFDVEDVTRYQFAAGVLINPVAVGSGVQLKMLDMLMTDAPIVSRRQGLAGLPESCADQVELAETPAEFASAILRRLTEPGVDPARRAEVRASFTLEGLREALAVV
ncbi:MAG: glycosyltransferase [Curtobacterium sp.]